jgi:hypothetical protein
VSQSDPSKNGRHSLFERIALTFTLDPTDRNILLALATFANYKTGRGAYPSLEKLSERCRVHPRNVRKALRRLQAAGYVTRTERTKLPTVYDVCLNKLAIDRKGTVEGGANAPLDDEPDDEKKGGANAPLDDEPDDELEGGANAPSEAVMGGVNAPLEGGQNGFSRGALTPADPPSTYRSSSTYDPPIKEDPPIVPRGFAPTPPTNPETTPAPPRSVWAGIGQVRRTGAARTIHERRTALIAKVLRTLIAQRATWPDHHAVKVALRAELKRQAILADLDYGQAHFDDAIAIVNTATPFIGRGVVH